MLALPPDPGPSASLYEDRLRRGQSTTSRPNTATDKRARARIATRGGTDRRASAGADGTAGQCPGERGMAASTEGNSGGAQNETERDGPNGHERHGNLLNLWRSNAATQRECPESCVAEVFRKIAKRQPLGRHRGSGPGQPGRDQPP